MKEVESLTEHEVNAPIPLEQSIGRQLKLAPRYTSRMTGWLTGDPPRRALPGCSIKITLDCFEDLQGPTFDINEVELTMAKTRARPADRSNAILLSRSIFWMSRIQQRDDER